MVQTYTWPEPLGVGDTKAAATYWVIRALGRIEDENGKATTTVENALRSHGFHMPRTELNKIFKELGDGGKYGPYIEREVEGRRTYWIDVVKPAPDILPPLVLHGDIVGDDDDDGEVDEAEPVYDEGWETDDAEIVERPGAEVTLVESAPAVSVMDKLLCIQSVVGECINDLVTEAVVDLDARISSQLQSYNRLLDEVERLRSDLRERDETIAKLRRALNTNGALRVRV